MKKLILIGFFLFGLLAVSCSKSDDNNSDNAYVNHWMLKTMRDYYYWNTFIPQNPNVEISPDNFFHSILYKYKQEDGDRFSFISNNFEALLASLQGVSKDIGFEFSLRGFSDNDNVWGEVLYVKPGTQAELKGIKRGNTFNAVDNIRLNKTNYKNLLKNDNLSITFSDPSIVDNTIGFDNERIVDLTKTVYPANPIYLDTVYNVEGNKVAYLVYNFFASDSGNESAKYDLELNSIFAKFKSEGVNNLIVDLRYNSGGSTLSATRLASMIVKHLSTNNIFYSLEYNKQNGKKDVPFVSSVSNNPINNIGDNLQKVCFITSSWSASASEMLIMGLKPLMTNDIILVGDTTVGKTYASVSFYKQNDPRNKWGIQPLIGFFTNGQGERVPTKGIAPDYELTELYFIPKKQLGDRDEEMLNKAISLVTGVAQTQSARAPIAIKSPVLETSIDKKSYSNKAILPNIDK